MKNYVLSSLATVALIISSCKTGQTYTEKDRQLESDVNDLLARIERKDNKKVSPENHYQSERQTSQKPFKDSLDKKDMRSLTTILASTTLAAAAYAQSPAPTTQPARYTPTIAATTVTSTHLDTSGILRTNEPIVEIQGTPYVVYESPIARPGEPQQMLRRKNDVMVNYTRGIDGKFVAQNEPLGFYVFTPLTDNKGRQAQGIALEQTAVDFNIPIVTMGMDSFYTPSLKDAEKTRLEGTVVPETTPFYLVGIIAGTESLTLRRIDRRNPESVAELHGPVFIGRYMPAADLAAQIEAEKAQRIADQKAENERKIAEEDAKKPKNSPAGTILFRDN